MGLAPYQIDAFAPDFAALECLWRGITVTAPGGELFAGSPATGHASAAARRSIWKAV